MVMLDVLITNKNTTMDNAKVDMFLLTNGKYFDAEYLPQIRERLLQLDNDKWPMIQTLQFKDPFIHLIISIIGGSLGIDRFLIGDILLGVLKLVTCGGLGIWYIVDFFLIMPATKEKNLNKLQLYMY